MTRALALSCALLAVLPQAGRPQRSGDPSVRIVVVLSADAAPYQQALAGLRANLGEHAKNLVVVPLHADTAQVREAILAIRSSGSAPDVIVTLGALATRAILTRVTDVPVVAGMILNPAELGGASNATGVYLEYPVEVELDWMTRILPRHRRIGIVYHSVESGRRVQQARRVGAIQAVRIEQPAELPDALQQLANRADVLWSLNDPVVYNPETARSLLLFSLRNRIPMVGPTAAWVRAGALYALDRDYGDVGAQSAQLVALVLDGTAPAAIAPVPPRRVRYSLNARTAADLDIELSPAIVRGAAEVVR